MLYAFDVNVMKGRLLPAPYTFAVDAGHFSLDFLPGDLTSYWRIKDSRGSLLLLHREGCKTERGDLIVCEPLTRRLKVIPRPKPIVSYWNNTAALLDDGEGESDKGGGSIIGMLSFRVLLCFDNEVTGRHVHLGQLLLA